MSLGGLASKEGRILQEHLLDIHQFILTHLSPVCFPAQVYFSCAAIPVGCFSLSLEAKRPWAVEFCKNTCPISFSPRFRNIRLSGSLHKYIFHAQPIT